MFHLPKPPAGTGGRTIRRHGTLHKQRGWAWLSWAIPAAAKAIEGITGQDAQRRATNRSIDLQKEFAQQGIQWKVADAKAAGVHPLYALGAQTHSFSPIQVGNPLGQAIGDMGQELGRAFNAQATNEQRQAQAIDLARHAEERLRMDRERHASQMANDEVQRQYWASRITTANQAGNPPAQAFGVSSSAAPITTVELQPDKQTYAKPGGYETAGTHPAFKEYRYGSQGRETMRLPSNEMGEALENMGLAKYPPLFEMYRGLWADELRKRGFLPGGPPDNRPGWKYYIGKGWRRPYDHR